MNALNTTENTFPSSVKYSNHPSGKSAIACYFAKYLFVISYKKSPPVDCCFRLNAQALYVIYAVSSAKKQNQANDYVQEKCLWSSLNQVLLEVASSPPNRSAAILMHTEEMKFLRIDLFSVHNKHVLCAHMFPNSMYNTTVIDSENPAVSHRLCR